MDNLPFTVYDFFGYLASGFVLLVAVVAAFVGYGPLQHGPNTIVGLLLVVAAYVTGHVVANLASDLIERRIVRRRLGMPTAILLRSSKPPKSFARLLPGYSTPLPADVCARIGKRADKEGVTDRGEALFYHCHAVMKVNTQVQARLNTFLNLYGFCRNMTMALLIAALALAVGMLIGTANTGPDAGPGWWILAAIVAAVGLFYRYLKFLRQFGIELLTSYAESKVA